jgi:hypothetical protein
VNLDNPSTLIAICTELLKRKLGEKTRIETIKARAEQGRILHQLDKKYIEKMAVYIKYEEPIEETPSPPPQETPPSPPRQGGNSFCSNCGTKILSSNNFCTNCGTKKVQISAQTRITQPTITPTPREEIPPAPHPLGKSNSPKPVRRKKRVPPDARFCVYCERYVTPERDFSVGALLILLLLGIIPGIIYYFLKAAVCPICKHHQWTFPEDDEGYDDEFRRPANF